MKLLFAPTSPYARKVLVMAHEAGLAEELENVLVLASPTAREPDTTAYNPLGKIPTLVTDVGTALFDSRVICEYLDARSRTGHLFPPAGPARWAALAEQALADGLLDAALLARYETVLRPPHLLWPDWRDGQIAKVTAALDMIERASASFGDRVDIGTIATACALGYLDFRFPDLAWRTERPQASLWFSCFGERPSMAATLPHILPS